MNKEVGRLVENIAIYNLDDEVDNKEIVQKKKRRNKTEEEMKTIRNQIHIKVLIQTICPGIFPSLIIYLVKKFKEVLIYL